MKRKITLAAIGVVGISIFSVSLLNQAQPIYTYDGFYAGLKLSREEQAIVDSKMLHISQSYLAPTQAYSLDSYPFEYVVENDYLKYHEKAINEYLEQMFREQTYGVVDIDIREDMIYDYQEIPFKGGKVIGQLTYDYDVIGYEEAEGISNKVFVDAELLNSLKKRDEFKPELFSPAREFGWYDELTTRRILTMYYSDQLTKYYSDIVEEVNDYLESTGRYYDKKRSDTCPYLGYINECAYTGNIKVGIAFSKYRKDLLNEFGWTEEFMKKDDNLVFYFAKNQMNASQIAEYIDQSLDYAFGIMVSPYISYELYEQGNLSNLDRDFKQTMRAFTDANLEWIIADKNQVKKILNQSDIIYNNASFKVGFGYQLSSDETEYESFTGKSIYSQMVRIYNEDYPWLTEDINRNDQFGHATEFEWRGNK